MTRIISWGAKVSDEFIDSVSWIAETLGIGLSTHDGTNLLMACMAWESGRSFDPAKFNLAGSGAVGLIQFMPFIAEALGTSTIKLSNMTPVEQLNYVYKYFKPYKGRLKNLADVYMAILWPAAVGQHMDFVLWDKATKPTTFRQNAGLDVNKNGKVTKAECAAKLYATLDEGFKEGNVRYKEEVNMNIDLKATAGKIVADHLGDVAQVAATEVLAQAIPAPEVHPLAKAASGWKGNLAGVAAVGGALLLNPDFTAAAGTFVTKLVSGQGIWGALVSLIGVGLIGYRAKGL